MMLKVKNLKTETIHYDSMSKDGILDNGPRFGKSVFEAYPMDKWEIVLMDGTYVLNEEYRRNHA